jgi:hypothetical protein
MQELPFSLVSESTNPTSREDFTESWLEEMPMGIPPQQYYPNLVQNIRERIAAGYAPELVKPGLYRIVGQSVVYYWYGDGDIVELGVEMTRRPQALVVNFTAKDPRLAGKPPYASDLYLDVLDSSHMPVRLVSDQSLSDEGLSIWRRLLEGGHKILVYDNNEPGTGRQLVSDTDELLRYFKHGEPDFKRYQYALVPPGEVLAEVISMFNTRRLRELSGLL